MIFEFKFNYDNKKYEFNIRKYEFSIDREYVFNEGLMITINNTNLPYPYKMFYSKTEDRIIWDFIAASIKSSVNWNIKREITKVNGYDRIVYEFEEGHWLAQKYGYDKLGIRKILENLFNENKDDIIETLEMIEFEATLD